MITDILNYGLDLKEFTIYNFASQTAQSSAGALLQAGRDFKKLLKAGYIEAIPCNIPPRNPRQETFYFVTLEGAKYVNRKEDYKRKARKAISNVAHDSGTKDLALQFIKLGYKVQFEVPVGKYNEGTVKKTMRCDFLASKGQNQRFFVENEIKLHPNRTYNDKIKKYENIKLPKGSKVLIVWQDTDYNTYLRKQTIQEFNRPELYDYHFKRQNSTDKQERIKANNWIRDYKGWKECQRKFEGLLEYAKQIKPINQHKGKKYYKYRLTTFDNFFKINEAVWYAPNCNNKLSLNL